MDRPNSSCRTVLEECGRSIVVSLAFENGSFACVSGILRRNEASVKLLFFLAVSMHGNFFCSYLALLNACTASLTFVLLPEIPHFPVVLEFEVAFWPLYFLQKETNGFEISSR